MLSLRPQGGTHVGVGLRALVLATLLVLSCASSSIDHLDGPQRAAPSPIHSSRRLAANCSQGEIRDAAGVCTVCAAGSVPSATQDVCKQCPKHHYSFEGDAKCKTCPAEGVVCDRILILKDDYWHDSQLAAENGITDATQFYPCRNELACEVNQTSSTVTCARGYSGVLCAVCADGFGETDTGCSACGSATLSWLLLLLLVSIVSVALVVAVVRVIRVDGARKFERREMFATLKVLFNFMQVTGFLAAFDLNWPSLLQNLFQAANSGFGFSANLSFVHCALGWTVYDRLLFFLVFSCLVITLPPVMISGYVCKKRWEFAKALMSGKKTDLPAIMPPVLILGTSPQGLFTTVTMMLLFVLYPTISRSALDVLSCTEPINGVRYVTSDMQLECGTSEHATFSALAWVLLGLVSLGFPFASFLLLYRFRNRLHESKIQRRLLFLYSGYRRRRYWWESVAILRKFLIVAITTQLDADSGHQIYAGLWVLLLSLFLHNFFRPFHDPLQDAMERVALSVSLVTLLLGQLFALGDTGDVVRWTVTILVIVLTSGVVLWLLLVLAKDLWQAAKSRQLSSHMAGVRARIAKEMSSRFKLNPMHNTRPSLKSMGLRKRGQSTANKPPQTRQEAAMAELGCCGCFPCCRPSADGTHSRVGDMWLRFKHATVAAADFVADGSIVDVTNNEDDGAATARPSNSEMARRSSSRSLVSKKPAADGTAAGGGTRRRRKRRSSMLGFLTSEEGGEDPKYFNSITKKQQWEKPDGFQDAPLPPDWEERFHPELPGVPYYLNTRTGEQQWQRPSADGEATPTSSEGTSGEAESKSARRKSTHTSSSHSKRNNGRRSSTSGKKRRHRSRKSTSAGHSSSKAAAAAVAAAAAAEAEHSPTSAPAPAPSPTPAPTPAPSPAPAPAPALAAAESSAEATVIEMADVSGAAGSSDTAAECEWEEAWSEEYECPYYLNRFTGEAVWEKPEGLV